MDDESPPPEGTGSIELPRWLQVPLGVLLGLFTLLCLLGSVTLIFSPNAKVPILAPVVGFVWVAGCAWVLEKCLRMLTGRKNRGGLMSSTSLRGLAWFFLLLPVGGLFTGYFLTHTLQAILQTSAYVSVFFGLRSLADARQRAAQPIAPADGLRPPLS